ncbi:unnamed protein product [Cylicostephanus goldi]|uniref:Carboxylesterase type B domain-containing protein n=1 Tax=Cylicostephanus goldi TaxID=71465 RepID=A0A3P6RXJ2_CYLGO|nr:unnamed protein product [Cylicostephanus goldi]
MEIRTRARISSLTLAKGVSFGKKRDNPNNCKVKTNYGMIEGRRYTTADGFQMDAFLGVPYAQPPVGELRFETQSWLAPVQVFCAASSRVSQAIDERYGTFPKTALAHQDDHHHRSG